MPASFPWNWTLKAQAGEGEKPTGVEEGSRTLRANGAQRKEGHDRESDHVEGLVPVPGQTVPLRSCVPRILEVTSAGSRVPADVAEIRGGQIPWLVFLSEKTHRHSEQRQRRDLE